MKRVSLMAAGLLLAGAVAGADGISIQPGLWEMTSTVQMPMMPEPRVTTETQCMDKEVISFDDLQSDQMDPRCTFESAQVEDKTMKWSFVCPVENGGTSRGDWQATSYGDRVEGGGTVSMTMQGQTMELTMSWTGKRVGPCP